MDRDTILSRLRESYRREPPAAAVRFILLHGSVARGTPRDDSDVDLGVRLADRHGLAALDVIGVLQDVGIRAAKALDLPEDRIDVKDLGGLGAYAAYRVAGEGICVYEVVPRERQEYVTRAWMEYFDFQYYESIHRAAMRQELLGARRGD